MPDETSLQRLISEARSNPEFFYRLVWDTERAVEEVDYLSPAQKESILAVQPEDLVVGLASNPGKAALVSREAFEEFDLSAVCGASCGASCGGSCAASCAGSCGGSCGGSCESSCAGTCGGSCGASCGTSCAASCAASCVVSGDAAIDIGYETLPPYMELTETIKLEIEAVKAGKTYTRFHR